MDQLRVTEAASSKNWEIWVDEKDELWVTMPDGKDILIWENRMDEVDAFLQLEQDFAEMLRSPRLPDDGDIVNYGFPRKNIEAYQRLIRSLQRRALKGMLVSKLDD